MHHSKTVGDWHDALLSLVYAGGEIIIKGPCLRDNVLQHQPIKWRIAMRCYNINFLLQNCGQFLKIIQYMFHDRMTENKGWLAERQPITCRLFR